VEGSWATDDHEAMVGTPGWKDEKEVYNLLYRCLKAGARANDEYVRGMIEYPEFHGWAYYKNPEPDDDPETYVDERCNYVACYFYFIDAAQDIFDDGLINEPQPSYLNEREWKTFCYNITNKKIGETSWKTIFSKYTLGNVTQARQCAFLYGMALHVATDTFAHSSYVLNENKEYVRLLHNTKPGADTSNYYPNRFACAKEIAEKVVKHYYNSGITPNKADADPSDFLLKNYDRDKLEFKLRNLTVYLKAMGADATKFCEDNSKYFEALNYTKPKK